MSGLVLNSIVFLLFICALFFFSVGSLGLIKLPDAYNRLHAAALGDTLGFGLTLLGLLLIASSSLLRIKLIGLGIIFWIINPTMGHAVAKVALLRGSQPYFKSKAKRR